MVAGDVRVAEVAQLPPAAIGQRPAPERVHRLRAMKASTATVEVISSRIVLVRGRRVLIDADLAELNGVSTKALNQPPGPDIAKMLIAQPQMLDY